MRVQKYIYKTASYFNVPFREFSFISMLLSYQYSPRIHFSKMKICFNVQCSPYVPNFEYNHIKCIIRLEVVCVMHPPQAFVQCSSY